MLTGKLPFDAAQPMDYLALQIRGTPIPLGERIPNLKLPPGLDVVVMKTIEKEPDKRHPTAADFAHALKECLQEEVRDDAMRSIPKPDDASRARVLAQQQNDSRQLRDSDGRSVSGGTRGAHGSSRPHDGLGTPGNSLPQSPMIWAAIGAGAMLVLGGVIVLAVMLLR
jgi:serine/threonine protein kinase